MTDSPRAAAGRTVARRVTLGLALATLIQGCASAVPHLRPGSNVALPRSEPSALVDLLLGGCQKPADSRTPARDMAECVHKDSVARTTPDPRSTDSPPTP